MWANSISAYCSFSVLCMEMFRDGQVCMHMNVNVNGVCVCVCVYNVYCRWNLSWLVFISSLQAIYDAYTLEFSAIKASHFSLLVYHTNLHGHYECSCSPIVSFYSFGLFVCLFALYRTSLTSNAITTHVYSVLNEMMIMVKTAWFYLRCYCCCCSHTSLNGKALKCCCWQSL